MQSFPGCVVLAVTLPVILGMSCTLSEDGYDDVDDDVEIGLPDIGDDLTGLLTIP